MKFLALNLDLSNLSSNPLGLRWSTHAGVKEWCPSKKWLLIRCWLVYSVKMVADRHRHAA